MHAAQSRHVVAQHSQPFELRKGEADLISAMEKQYGCDVEKAKRQLGAIDESEILVETTPKKSPVWAP